jgi:MscS family membrane protein
MNTELFYGNTIQEWLISLAIIVGALILNKIIILLNKHVIQRITSKTKSRVDDILFKMLQAPVLFGIILASIWVAANRLNLDKDIVNIIDKSYKILIVINITWFVARLTRALIEEFWVLEADKNNHKRIDSHMIILIRRIIIGAIWAIGFVMALNNVGVNISALLGTLGIGGLAFALAAQDTLKNIFGGLTIFTDKPFKHGDRILVNGVDGFVEDIGIRSIRIRTLEKKLVTIPNSKISDAAIENITAEPMKRVLLKLGLSYETKPEKMKEALDILKSIPQKIKETDKKECVAFFSDYKEYSLEVTYIYFIKKEADIPSTISKVNAEILESFCAAGIEFAFPTQTIHVVQPAPVE